jgi:hypothetical protein
MHGTMTPRDEALMWRQPSNPEKRRPVPAVPVVPGPTWRKVVVREVTFACHHGGMTELEKAELTDGQGRALSAHNSYEGYAERTMMRALAATRKRHALATASANVTGTEFRNG